MQGWIPEDFEKMIKRNKKGKMKPFKVTYNGTKRKVIDYWFGSSPVPNSDIFMITLEGEVFGELREDDENITYGEFMEGIGKWQ